MNNFGERHGGGADGAAGGGAGGFDGERLDGSDAYNGEHHAALETIEQGEHHAPNGDTKTSEAAKADEHFMRLALEQANEAFKLEEVPIGAVVVADGQVISAAYNRRELDADPASHAEFLALELASKKLGRWRLSDCSVYVTLEPCLMCAGLMYQARIKRCIYGAKDPKAGALGSLYSVHEDTRLNHRFEVESGVLAEQSSNLLKIFFSKLRQKH